MNYDFCRMTANQTYRYGGRINQRRQAKQSPALFRPIVAIGHTKDLVDTDADESFLSYLEREGISVSIFEEEYPTEANIEYDVGKKPLHFVVSARHPQAMKMIIELGSYATRHELFVKTFLD